MKIYRSLFFVFFACLLTAVPISAQQAAAEKKAYQKIVVEKFTIREGVEFPADKIDSLTKSLQNTLTRSNRFQQVSLAGESTEVDAADSPSLKITGEVIKYVKGNRAARYIVGLGVGATKIITDVKFIDVATGEVVHHQTVDGDVTWGFFGGDSDGAKNGVADEIIRVMKKNKLAGDKIKKTN